MLSGESDNNGRSVGQSDLPDDGRPTTERRALQTEEQKDTAKEAKSSATFAQFLACLHVGGKQERFFWRLGFQGTTATACRVAWIQAMRRRPQ
jgi:hypothetical protein